MVRCLVAFVPWPKGFWEKGRCAFWTVDGFGIGFGKLVKLDNIQLSWCLMIQESCWSIKISQVSVVQYLDDSKLILFVFRKCCAGLAVQIFFYYIMIIMACWHCQLLAMQWRSSTGYFDFSDFLRWKIRPAPSLVIRLGCADLSSCTSRAAQIGDSSFTDAFATQSCTASSVALDQILWGLERWCKGIWICI